MWLMSSIWADEIFSLHLEIDTCFLMTSFCFEMPKWVCLLDTTRYLLNSYSLLLRCFSKMEKKDCKVIMIKLEVLIFAVLEKCDFCCLKSNFNHNYTPNPVLWIHDIKVNWDYSQEVNAAGSKYIAENGLLQLN